MIDLSEYGASPDFLNAERQTILDTGSRVLKPHLEVLNAFTGISEPLIVGLVYINDVACPVFLDYLGSNTIPQRFFVLPSVEEDESGMPVTNLSESRVVKIHSYVDAYSGVVGYIGESLEKGIRVYSHSYPYREAVSFAPFSNEDGSIDLARNKFPLTGWGISEDNMLRLFEDSDVATALIAGATEYWGFDPNDLDR